MSSFGKIWVCSAAIKAEFTNFRHNISKSAKPTAENCTRNYLRTLEQDTGIHSIPFTDIPVKSPDASPMDFSA